MVYYNEHDPFAAAWLRELIKEGVIADGEVDERDIQTIKADELRDFTQCHFFAGIGGWSLALRLAGWSDDRPVWTGSCPCQPFSAAGANIGGDDPRHLWPTWFKLITECRPGVVFGEQVAAAINHGWLDLVFDDLEREGYAAGAVGLPACSVGAFHIRQRVWFVAEPNGGNESKKRTGDESRREQPEGWRPAVGPRARAASGDGDRAVADPDGRNPRHGGLQRGGFDGLRAEGRHANGHAGHAERPEGAWSDVEWIACRDGKARPVKPGICPLAHGVSNRVGTLRGAGNAIVPEVAAEVIAAYMAVVDRN